MCPMSTKQTKAPKEKRRNSERRKEKSRDAARCRRGRETEIFTDLAQALPLAPGSCNTLDKASVMRLAISYLKARKVAELVPARSLAVTGGAADGECLQALQGFLLVVSSDGDMVFLSENVSQHLGLSQMDLMGNSIFEFSHPCDHDELREVLGIAKSGNKASSKAVVPAESLVPQSFFLRMKCTLTTKGRNVNLKSASYKVIHCTGHILRKPAIKEEKGAGHSSNGKQKVEKEEPLQRCLVAIGEPIPHPANIEIPLDKQTFLSKHSLDMKFTYADDNIGDFLGYDPDDLIDRSFFEFHHALDHEIVHKGFKNLFAKGQSEIGRYRFLAQGGGYVWVLTQATLLHGGKAQQPISVVCVNFVISGVEAGDEVCSVNQLTAVKDDEPPPLLPPAAPVESKPQPKQQPPPSPTRSVAAPSPLPYPLPQAATSKIFAPRTEDMSKGFLTFSDDEPGLTLLKEEPEDLTHLAPMAGDVDIPLDGPPFLEDDVFNEFMMANYCPLDLMPEEDDTDSASGSNCSPHDPFLTYRSDNSNHSSSDQKLGSPLQGSDRDSLPSLCSPESKDSSKLLDEDDELTFRAPYIPMGPEDTELPFLISPDPIWCALSPPSDRPPDTPKSMQLSPVPSDSSSKSCWSAQNSPPSLNSNLAQLLLGDAVKAESPTSMLQEEDKLSTTLMSQLLQKVKIPNQGVRISCPATPQKSKRQAQDFLSVEEPKRAKHSSELLQRLMAPKTASWVDEGIKSKNNSVLMNLLDDQPPPLEEAGYLEAGKGLPPLEVPPPESARASPDLMLSDVEAVLRYLNSE